MARIRLSTEEIKYMNLFESMTGASVEDCVQEEDSIGFIVKKGDMGLAIGKGGANIERVKSAIRKGVWVMEGADQVDEFIRNMFSPTKIRNVRMSPGPEKVLTLEVSRKDASRVIGQNGGRIKIAKKLAERHFDVDDIKVKSIY